MRIQTNNKPLGGALVVTLFIILVISFVLASYLALMLNESTAVARSQSWNACVPVMEAGVEEAMAQIHYCQNSTNLSSNNWTLGTNGCYQKTRTIGTGGSYCEIAIQPVIPPVIYSTAYVPVPVSASSYITRQVRVTTRTQQAAPGGLTAKGSILLTSSTTFDSFDSSVAPYNPATPGTNALALTDSFSTNAIDVTSGHIYGMAVTGPGGTVATSSTAAIGDANWNTNHTGIEPGWSANDANVQINDNSAPSTSGWVTSIFPGVISSTNYTYYLGTGNYYISGSFHIRNGQSVGVSGNATLYVSGNFSVRGSGYIYLAPGSALTLYVGGTNSIAGVGIVNETSYAANLTIYGLPTCSTVTYSGSAAFIGTVNAPEGAFTFSGGAGAYGSFIAASILISGSGGIHYDQALGAGRSLVAVSWNEL
jgi:hypothetical protein